jgi:four helix bundle protein
VDESFRELDVWKKSVALATKLYGLTSGFPETERQGLASEIRKVATSVATNIAEGWGRASTGEYIYFWSLARKSLIELETQLAVASNLHLLKSHEYVAVAAPVHDIRKMINRLIAALKSQKDEPESASASASRTPCPVSLVPCPLSRNRCPEEFK